MKKDELLSEVRNELRLRYYSPKTIKNYLRCLEEYFKVKQYNLNDLDETHLRAFLLKKQDQGYSSQTINLYLNAIKFFYYQVLKSHQKITIRFAKRTKKLPVILSREEVQQILSVIKNSKHRLLIALAYGAGLRVSEAVSLRVGDLNFEDMLLNIREGKGKRDRVTLLPQKLLFSLQMNVENKGLNDPIFQSERGGRLTERTAQKIFEKVRIVSF